MFNGHSNFHSVGTAGCLDPDVRGLLELAAASAQRPITDLSPKEARQEFALRVSKTNAPPLEGVTVTQTELEGPAGPFQARIYHPALAPAPPLPVILYFHGGGFVIGDLNTHDPICRTLAIGSRSVVVSVDYHLAPEHPYPAAVRDAVAALNWVGAHADKLGADPTTLAVCGDSAGGTLAAVVAQHARDHGGPALAMQILLYPAVDQGGDYPSRDRFANGYLLTSDAITWFGKQYFGEQPPVLAPSASPIRAPSLQHLPPALVVTAGFDPLRDEGLAYAERLANAGVAVDYVCYEGTVHGFLGMARYLGSGRAALQEVCRAWRRVWEKQRR
jgi:acetyl esterase